MPDRLGMEVSVKSFAPVALFLFMSLPLAAATGPLPPIQNDSLLGDQKSDLLLKQQKFMGGEDLGHKEKSLYLRQQRQEEAPPLIRIKEVKTKMGEESRSKL